jgi:valyl-tRNA synthetase
LNSDGTINENGGMFKGMPRYLVREKIIEELQKLGLFKGKKKNPMNLQICSKSGDIIEPKLVP